ncbi:CTP synthase [Candidatus Magnetominusculus xianensis]|uniref:CTP synthase n=1 Tax=Candidatus Magnetominusculus xianensis TaxID=1748249 RepID=A0ABR5SHD1_9BACT|nr:CTP synthase [Candidatus Magnetominusculus xianensis]KWT85576.1 CTP synthase [Candidatus Magnetominusculus xianensis]MBF0404193.1 CTP synthase [Nitrospirota bacterium]
MAKYIFLTGGVVSSLGKGIAASSIGALLEGRGLRVNLQKLDPYINIDPGTMSPFQHGEVFVTDDGTETDLDLGHYERFTHIRTNIASNYTSGKIYFNVITKERKGDYLGQTVQVVPHITDEIKSVIMALSHGVDVVIVEIGGTIGDIESLPFLEAIRQIRFDVGKENVFYIHLTLVPYIHSAGELKSKPTQHSVKELRAIGIQPDAVLCRCDRPLPDDMKRKIALHCNLDYEAVIGALDVKTIYEVPLVLHEEGLDELIVRVFNLQTRPPDLTVWKEVVRRIKEPVNKAVIAMVGKYIEYQDAYKSLVDALIHGGIANDAEIVFQWVDAEEIERSGPNVLLSEVDGILVPGGFGNRGIEGKIQAARYAREKKIPYFGICLGMQCAVIEFARNVCSLPTANSSEFDEGTADAVIYLMEQWYDFRKGRIEKRNPESAKGGTMRLGAYPCTLVSGIPETKAYAAYGRDEISERHRHRYEFNNKYRELLQSKGLVISGLSPDGELVEIIEFINHPWFLGCQFHPEFTSKPTEPHPLFRSFIEAALKEKKHLFPYERKPLRAEKGHPYVT